MMKLQREKEVIQTEFDMIKERWDKTHSVHQKLQVRSCMHLKNI